MYIQWRNHELDEIDFLTKIQFLNTVHRPAADG